MDDEEDVKKMMEVIECCKLENEEDIQYDEFISYEESDVEENEEVPNIEDEYFLTDLTNTDISSISTHDPRSTLKLEERLVIDSCSESELKDLLLLNRTKNIQLIQLHKKIKDLLIECQKNIAEKSDVIKAHNTANKWQCRSTGAWRLAAPYFKDKQHFTCPPNLDIIRKQNNKELSVYDLSCPPKWSTLECEKLVRAVKLNYNINQQTAIVKEIQDIKQNIDLDNTTLNLIELEARLEELRDNDDSEIPPLNSDEYINWMRVADTFLQDKHSAFECRSFWHIYLHPFINKSLWTPEEDTKVKELAKKYNFQNWEQIAKDLATNRTGFTACVNYYRNLHNRFKKGEFTHEEDAKLLELIYQYKMGNYIPWFKVVQHFKNRTRSQLHYRYSYYLSQNDRKRGKFSEAEDVLLMILGDKFGNNYKKYQDYLPNRSMVQCKSRYNSILQGSIKKGSFTIEEDQTIMKHVEEHGIKSWTKITKLLCRTRGQIRQRYHTIKQFLESNPDSTIENVPRRKHNLKADENSFQMLRLIADQYRDSANIPNLHEIKKKLSNSRIDKASLLTDMEESEELASEEELSAKTREQIHVPVNSLDVDNLLTDFFCNSFKINTINHISAVNLERATQDVETILDVLKVDLDIPYNFGENAELDNIDVVILSNILEKKKSRVTPGISHNDTDKGISLSISPNLNTIIGLRSLLIKFSSFKSEEKETVLKFMNSTHKSEEVSRVRCDIIKHISSLPPDIQMQVEMERKLFYRRFYSLFKWPAIMTLENPLADLVSTTKSNKYIEVRHVERTYTKDKKSNEISQIKRTYSKLDSKNENNSEVKRMKISEMPSTSSNVVPLKLTPITDKSVIEGLLKDKSKKLFLFDQVSCAGETKTIIRELNISHIREDISPTSSRKVNNSNELRNPSERISCQASTSSNENGELFKFNPEQGECIIMDSDSCDDNIGCEDGDTTIDDVEDLERLNRFLSQEQDQDQDIDGEDWQDLQKLETLLKNEKKYTNNHSNDPPLFV